ncbi:DUF1295-domain-containing protein [Coemansia reversa NRRL 1564]|uniref:DUF1295-domain-containing protein n=1 Tax=Coemansia reversa (strain ATCC 12441 / NRRL 1564) TaxID=763665 RepID=A0A2G5BLD9_COERN|nr:DUF1295-domain-containing protein [Coemansia reversa NRRL 1564]|eukprot:PIA19782.1 DUF1295-domain-containing protein [Coemansia reversa NRRL 1564]
MLECAVHSIEVLKTQMLRVFEKYPLEETEHIRGLFWGTVIGSWLLTFVKQNGRRNYSIVDRLWPIFPAGLVVQWTYDRWTQDIAKNGQAIVAVALVIIWSIRLSYNSARRGDYALGAEDYRWKVVRKRMEQCYFIPRIAKGIVWELFNAVFISWFQLALLYHLVVPVRQLLYAYTSEWSIGTFILALLMVGLLVGEALADQQQFNFQQLKKQGGEERSGDVAAGFVSTGLWRFSRHPNVFCEQAFWLAMAVFCGRALGTEAEGECCHLFVGSFVLIALMWGSVSLTESISSQKYPLYQAYQLRTSRLIPCTPLSNAQVIARAHKHRSRA